MIKNVLLFTVISVLLVTTIVHAQTGSLTLSHHIKASQQFTTKYLLEKVHLHLDRPWYGLGDTIWFKAYTVAGSNHRLSALSGVLYTELINTSDTVVQRLTLQLSSGIGAGRFVLPYTYKSGVYRIRAYTNWMRNDSASYFYDQKVIIGGLGPEEQLASTKIKSNSSLNVAMASKEQSNPDIQFFPEGGHLVNGLRSKVAFKAINRDGLAANVHGVIIDEDNNELASFNTQHSGMGQFALTPQAGKQYKARIVCSDGGSYLLDLPRALDEGFTLTINNNADTLYIKIAVNNLLYSDSADSAFYLIAESAGQCYFATSGKLTDRVFTAQIARSRFPSGIAQFTLFSQSGEPLNERVVFIRNADQLKLNVSTEKGSYAPHEKVIINLQSKNEENKPVAGTFSIAVTDETKVPVDEKAENTILTDLLLKSELRGYIENPNYYFLDESDKARLDLDLLMLTQGYRRFDWKQILAGRTPNITFQPEAALTLSGTIKTLSNKPVANGKIQLTSIKDQFFADTLSDANGDFTFTNLNFNDSTKVIISAKKAKGGNSLNISIKQLSFPAISKSQAVNDENETMTEPVLTALKKTYFIGRQQSLKNVIQLKEVKIKTRRNTFFNPVYTDNMRFSSNLNGPGNANQVVLSEQLTQGGGGKLSDILRGKILGLNWVNGVPFSTRTTHITGSRPMTIFLEGVQLSPYELDTINPYDIYSIEVLTSISYLSVYGSNAPQGALIITLKHGTHPIDVTKRAVDGLTTYNFKGFYRAREFYSPRYDIKATTTIADDRTTIYWNPNVITGDDGKTSLEYCNAGRPGTYRIVIEGIDADGNLGRRIFRYKVE